MAFDIAALAGDIFTKDFLKGILGGFVYIAGIAIIIIFGFIWIKKKMLYKIPVSAILLKENGTHKRRDDLKGGIVKNRTGVSDFQIQIPRQFKKKRLGYVPDFSLSDAKDRLLFIQIGDGEIWQQCRETIVTEKEAEVTVEEDGKLVKKTINYNLVAEAIPTDIKQVTINAIMQTEAILEQNKLTAMKISIGAFLLMVFVHVIFIFLTTK